MTPKDIPYVGAVFRFGAHDHVLDSILLLGPVVILTFVILGRTPLTAVVTVLYILSFVGYVIYKGIR